MTDLVGKEAQKQWGDNPGEAFAIHAGLGAVEGFIAGTVGTIVDGALPAASAEVSTVAGAAEEEAVELAPGTFGRSGVSAASEDARVPLQRWARRRDVLQDAAPRATTLRQVFTYVGKVARDVDTKFWNAMKLGGAKAKNILTTKEGMRNYLIKTFGVAYSEAVLITAPMSSTLNSSDPNKQRAAPAPAADSNAQSFVPLVIHVQGCIGRKGLPAVQGHMHIATAEMEPGDNRDGISSYAYVTHSPTNKALLQFEESKAGDGFHIRTSKGHYLAVANDHSTDRRGKDALFVHTTSLNSTRPTTPATWAVEIYEEVNVVLKLINAGNSSGSRMNGGYLSARFNKGSDGRKDGGAYLNVHNDPNGDHQASMLGFRVMRPDKLWWMDAVGDYECHKYDNGGKNLYHYVTIAESMDHQGLYWMNRAERAWTLTPQHGTRDTLLTHKDCPYFKDPIGHTECKVIFDSDQNVLCVVGPSNERYERLWWRDLEGMMFGGPDDRERITFTRNVERKYMILNRRFSTGLEVSQILEGSYQNRNVLYGVGGESFVEIVRDSFGGLVTGLKFSSEQTIFKHYGLIELHGRYVTQTEDEKSKRVVSTYMSIHGSVKGTAEVWWQGTNGEAWSLKYASRNKLVVGETCPYLKDGYRECSISRNADGEVESLVGPGGRIFKRI